MFGTATVKIRPTKMALLVDPQNVSQTREAIRLASSLWGGHYFPIIPLYERAPPSWRKQSVLAPTARQKVEGYLDAFDSDILVQFCDALPPYIAQTRRLILKADDVWGRWSHSGQPSYGLGVFLLLRDIYKRCFEYKQRYPSKVCIPRLPSDLGLFWASIFGDYTDAIRAKVDEHYAEVMDIETPEASPELLRAAMTEPTFAPRNITRWDIESYGVVGFGNQVNIFVLDASKVDDVIDFWNLRASGREVLPLPQQFLHDQAWTRCVDVFVKTEQQFWKNVERGCAITIIKSHHAKMDDIRSYIQRVDSLKADANSAHPIEVSIQQWFPRIWFKWAHIHDGGVADVYAAGEQTIDIHNASDPTLRLKPALPSFVNSDWIYTDALCANELALNIYGAEDFFAEVYPPIEGEHLARAVSGLTSLPGEWRIGRHGQVRLVKNRFSESRSIPTSEAIFFAWMHDRGWQSELSPPGMLAKQIFKRLNGDTGLFADKAVLGLIEHMNGGSVAQDGAPHREGNFASAREVSVGEIKRRLKSRSDDAGVYDTLVKKGVFRVGLQAQCPTCQRRTWSPLSALNEILECPKCLSNFPAAGHLDKSPGEWFYRTVGPFSVPKYADGAYSVLLAIHALSGVGLRMLHKTVVASFTAKQPGKKDLEADFAMFWREDFGDDPIEGLLFGECKTYGEFQAKDFDRMEYLAETFPGCVLAFATLRESLSSQETKALKRLARRGRRRWLTDKTLNPVLILTGTELLNPLGPPYCWSDVQRKALHVGGGLLNLCDATQQLYLGLPSLDEEWLKQSERRRARRNRHAHG